MALTEEEKKERNKESKKKWYAKNSEKVKENSKKWREDNPEKVKETKKRFRLKKGIKPIIKLTEEEKKKRNLESTRKYRLKKGIKPRVKLTEEEKKERKKELGRKWQKENPDKVKKINRKWKNKNIEKLKETDKKYRSNKYLNDSFFKLKKDIRSIINQSLHRKNYTKKSRTHEILGCSYEDFKIHLEKQFESWMNWNNKGNPKDGKFEINKTWDIDHIIPLSSATTEEELIKLNHYTNLRPLCSYYNRWIKKHHLEENLKKDLVDNL